jgi:hypothetical protein
LICTLAVQFGMYLVPGVQYQNPVDLDHRLFVAGLLNGRITPRVMLLAGRCWCSRQGTVPSVINRLLLYLVGSSTTGFRSRISGGVLGRAG